MQKVFIGIDFSINSPGITIFKDNQFIFTSFTNNEGKTLKKIPKSLQLHFDLVENNSINLEFYNRRKRDENYSLDQFQKIEDSKSLAEHIVRYLKQFTKDCEVMIGIEGYAYGSKGNSFLDLIAFNSVMRNYLYNEFYEKDKFNIKIFSPSEVKKCAGKGNANKSMMYQYWITNILSDKELEKSNLYQWCLSNSDRIDVENIPKPIEDIVDSYFVCSILRKELAKV